MRKEVDVVVAATAARQHGLVTRSQALGTGMTARQIQWRLERGVWQAVEHGVYRQAGAPFTWSTKVLAAVLASGGIASHRSAPVIWNIGGVRQGSPEITVARPARFRRQGTRVHESGDLHLAGRRMREGIPVTSVTRTLVDLGASLPWTVVEQATMDALDRKLATWDGVLRDYARHSIQGRTGCGAIRRVIDKNIKKALPGSRLELRCERTLVRAGLPEPVRQLVVSDRRGFIGRVDLAYERERIVIEVDGRSVHARRLAFEADALRRSRLSAAGWAVIHVTWEQLLSDPDGVVTRVRDALAHTKAA